MLTFKNLTPNEALPPEKNSRFSFLQFLLKYLFPLAVTISPWTAFTAGGSMTGFFLLRSAAPQIQNSAVKSFSTFSQFYMKGEFQPSNKIKTQMHFLSSQNYGKTIDSFEDLFQFYPSAHWLLSESVKLRLGRNLYEKNPISLSLNPFESSWYSLDGVILEYTSTQQAVNFDLWSAYLPKRWTANEREREFNYGFGFSLDINLTAVYINSFHFQVSYLADSFFDQEAKKMSRYGFTVNGTVKVLDLDYNFSAVGHGSGLQFKLEENMYHGDVRYKKPDFFNSEFFAGYHTDSPEYNPWLYNRHKNSGLSDFLQWRNLSYYFIGAAFSPLKKLDLQFVFLDFNSSSEGEIELGSFGSLIHNNEKRLPITKQETLGREFNIQALSKINKELEITLLTAFFLAQSHTLATNKKDFYNNIQLTARYKF